MLGCFFYELQILFLLDLTKWNWLKGNSLWTFTISRGKFQKATTKPVEMWKLGKFFFGLFSTLSTLLKKPCSLTILLYTEFTEYLYRFESIISKSQFSYLRGEQEKFFNFLLFLYPSQTFSHKNSQTIFKFTFLHTKKNSIKNVSQNYDVIREKQKYKQENALKYKKK